MDVNTCLINTLRFIHRVCRGGVAVCGPCMRSSRRYLKQPGFEACPRSLQFQRVAAIPRCYGRVAAKQ